MIDRFTIKNKNLYSFCLKASQPVSNWIPTDKCKLVGKLIYLFCIISAIVVFNILLCFQQEVYVTLTTSILNTLLLFIFFSFGYVLYYRLNTCARFSMLFCFYAIFLVLFIVQYCFFNPVNYKKWTDEDTKKKEQSKKTYIKVVGILNITFLLFIILGLDACGYIKKFC